MNLNFKRLLRSRDRGLDPPADSPSGRRAGFLRRLFGKKRGQHSQITSTDVPPVTSPSRSSSTISESPFSNASDSATPRNDESLWDRAYKALSAERPAMVKEYQDLLAREFGSMCSASNETPSVSLAPTNDSTHDSITPFDHDQILALSKEGLARMEQRTKIEIGRIEIIPKEHIAQATQILSWAKDWVGDAVQASPAASIAWAGVCLILPLFTNPVTAGEANRNGMADVMASMRRFTELESRIADLSRNSRVTKPIAKVYDSFVELYQRMLDFQISSVLRFYDTPSKRYVKDMFSTEEWRKKRESIEELKATINEYLSQIAGLVAVEELDLLNKKHDEALQNLQRLLSVSKEQLTVAEQQRDLMRDKISSDQDRAKQKELEKDEKYHQLFNLIATDNNVSYEWYKNRNPDRVEGTCQWFLTHPVFKDWMSQKSGILLVSADPGCGKSVLARHLVENVLQSPAQPATVCYFFFKDQDQNTERQALCALVHQLFSQKPFLIKYAREEKFVSPEYIIHAPESLRSIFSNAVQDSRVEQVVVVLDALDECSEKGFHSLMEYLSKLLENNPGGHKIKFLITSRAYPQIMSAFRDLSHIEILGEEYSEAMSTEINSVIKVRADALDLPDQFKRQLTEKMLEIPHRTYLWVHLVFVNLKKGDYKKTANGINDLLTTLPRNNYAAYNQILEKSTNPEQAKKALAIILAAQRPLTISEMNIAMGLQDNHRNIK